MATTTSCPDGHRCDNGGLCAVHPTKEGNYYCVCDVAFAGLSCEHDVTVYCTENGEPSKTSFCANGGECSDSGCICKEGYKGNFCEFTSSQTVPDDWPTLLNSFEEQETAAAATSSRSNNNKSGAVAGGVVAAVVFLGLILTVVVFRRRRFAQPMVTKSATSSDVSELQLDPDGGALSKAMSGDFDEKKEPEDTDVV